MITQSWDKIFVMYEFSVSTESRYHDDDDDDDGVELAPSKSRGESKSTADNVSVSRYGDEFVQQQVNPFRGVSIRCYCHSWEKAVKEGHI